MIQTRTVKLRIVSISLSTLLAAAMPGSSAARGNPIQQSGISASELRNLADVLPPKSGSIQSIEFLRSDGFSIDRAAVLTQPRGGGWKILVFHLEKNGKFAPEWKSETLTDSFAVSSSSAFQTRTVGTAEQVLQFSGCAAHTCPDVFSVLLYSPLKKAAFTATYIHGKVTYSPNLDSPDNRDYKNAVDEFVKKRRTGRTEDKRGQHGSLSE